VHTGSAPAYPLAHAYLYLTGGCNLRCAHCWISPAYSPRGEIPGDSLSADDVRKVIDEAGPLGLCQVKLTGGEPFLNRNIFEIIEVAAARGLTIFIETNATLIDRDAAAFLKRHGVTSLSVSIDSHRPAFHDSFRGVKGAFDDAVSGVELLTAEGISVQLIMSLVSENAGDIEGVVDLARRTGASSVKINPVNPVGRGGALMDRGKTLSARQLIDLGRWVEEELSRRTGIDTFFTIPSAFKRIGHLFDSRNSQCRILNIIGILSDGGVSICGIGRQEPSLLMGNIRTDDLARIWTESPVLSELRSVVPHGMEGVCGLCAMRGICLGSCRADAYVLSGSLSAPYWICREAYENGFFPLSRVVQR
jgi:SynChlorMet cassette radical SAM/SPASM protein ScmF